MNASFRLSSSGLILSLLLCITVSARALDTLRVHYSVQQCDSLIQANFNNPDFVVLDVRTIGEYQPQHLQGAINRDYYSANFAQTINGLPKHKTYVLYCGSGGRSGQTFNLMLGFGFPRIVNMLGGLGAWAAASLPYDGSFFPRLLAVGDTVFSVKQVGVGHRDTVQIKLTNRGNDTLKFLGFSALSASSFSSDFDSSKIIPGAGDYSFNIFYLPVAVGLDSLYLSIISNGGIINIKIDREAVSTQHVAQSPNTRISAYPNPVQHTLFVDGIDAGPESLFTLTSIQGQCVIRGFIIGNQIDVSAVPRGVYVLRIGRGSEARAMKVVVD